VPLFGATHLSIIAAIVFTAVALSMLCRARRISPRVTRLSLGIGLALNEFVWWWYRYSHEGIHVANLPLQLCDLTVWLSVAACLTLAPGVVEFAYFAGLAGAGMAVLTPDLWSPWPTYPAIYFFVAHGGIVIAVCVLVFGRIAELRPGAVWRAFGWLVAYATALGVFNAVTGANYMFLCRKPKNASLLDALGPWPIYLIPAAVVALALFWVLWLPARPHGKASLTTHCRL
jgi:hypothetical integral membrane protein (TIGR02206 family)